jgi:hypothetical protein
MIDAEPPSDALLASFCGLIYSATGPIADWDHYDPGLDDGVCWALKQLSGYDVVAFRGSTTFQDWVRDFRAQPVETRIGTVHFGFHQGMERVWREVRPLLSNPAIITGHSLGAGRAAIMTGLMVKDDVPPAARVVFGEPKPGYADLAKLISAVPGRSYRNGDATHHDLVTDVPFTFPPFEYTHPTPIIPVCAEPPANDRWGAFSYHHIELYEAALAALATKETASC